MACEANCLYERHGQAYVPTELTRGPWDPAAQHGGPPAALLAGGIERHDGGGFHVARVTVELLRPVPLAPLRMEVRFLRPGRRVQWLEARLLGGEGEVARATGVRIRRAEVELPPWEDPQRPPPGPDAGRPSLPPWPDADRPAFHSHAVEHRFVAGSFGTPGPAADWIRLRVPLVGGEPLTPLARVVAAADCGNGISWVLPRSEGYAFVNPDLTVHLHRHPEGEWVCLQAVTAVQPHGAGMAESRLWDRRGPLGRSLQSLLVDRTGPGR